MRLTTAKVNGVYSRLSLRESGATFAAKGDYAKMSSQKEIQLMPIIKRIPTIFAFAFA